jgi:hypothetical protein
LRAEKAIALRQKMVGAMANNRRWIIALPGRI